MEYQNVNKETYKDVITMMHPKLDTIDTIDTIDTKDMQEFVEEVVIKILK